MLVQKIDNHVAQALARLLQQYKGRPRIAGMYTAFVDQIQDLEDAIYALDAGRQLWNGTSSPAIGEQLDQIGTIVGISRNGLSDAEYLLFIFGKISENFSDTTIATILTVVGYLFQAEEVLLQEIYPAGVAIQVLGTTIPSSLFKIAESLVQASLGAGIQLVFMATSPTVNAFRFNGPGVNGATNGFGSLTDPTVGGVFVELII